jgi:hypothetical protein
VSGCDVELTFMLGFLILICILIFYFILEGGGGGGGLGFMCSNVSELN